MKINLPCIINISILRQQYKKTMQALEKKKTLAQSERLTQDSFAFKAYEKVQQKWEPFQNFVVKKGSYATIPFQNISKIKVKADMGIKNMYQIKLTSGNKDLFLCLSVKEQVLSFIQLLKGKIQTSLNIRPLDEIFVNLCEGEIFKKQFFFGSWEKCYLFISKSGMTCSMSKQTEAQIYINDVKQIWTRFQFIEKNQFIIFKTKQRLIKYEFAVPVIHALKWGRAFCSLIQYQQ